MRILRNTAVNFDVLTIDEKKKTVQVHDMYLKKTLEKGIDIPSFLQASYNNQEKVKLSDKNFIKAFEEIYLPNTMNKMKQVYKWRMT